MEEKRVAATAKNAEVEILKMLDVAEQKVHRTVEEASKTANEEASKTFSVAHSTKFSLSPAIRAWRTLLIVGRLDSVA
jgi:magnesium-transporting ATPase (P-type)